MTRLRLDPSILLDGFAAATMGAAVAFALVAVAAAQAPLAAGAAVCAMVVTFAGLRQVDARPRAVAATFGVEPVEFEELQLEEPLETGSAPRAAKDAAEELRDALHELRRSMR